MDLKRYKKMRKFGRTPEPEGDIHKADGPLRFVVQLHAASRTHYDFRLEMGGTLKSWAVPKGPSLDPMERRLAVRTEDHPHDYSHFEGVIPPGNYGAGTVMIWDEGTFTARETTDRTEGEAILLKNLAKGHITFVLQGEKLKGEFALIKLARGEENAWLLVKKHDQYVSRREITHADRSARSGRTMGEIAKESQEQKVFWHGKNQQTESFTPTEKAKPLTLKKPKTLTAKQWEDMLKATPHESLPAKMKPAKTHAEKKPFDRKHWFFERCWDGYRALIVTGEDPAIYSRTGINLARKFPAFVNELEQISVTMILDGFIVATNAEGAPRRKGTGSPDGAESGSRYVFYAMDVLHYAGHNLRELSLQQRKAALVKILDAVAEPLRLNPFVEDQGQAFYATLSLDTVKAMLARNGESPYASDKDSVDWLTIALPHSADGVSVEPEVGVQDMTPQRDAKTPPTEGRKKTPSVPVPSSVPLTNLTKIYWPDERYTKGDLIDYYRSIAPVILPHLKDRPESLHRHPNGIESESFFQKEMAGQVPRWADTATVTSGHSGSSITYIVCQNAATLLYMANLGCIELNPWLSRIDTLEYPDYVVIDLDPNEAPFSAVITVALEVRKVMDEIGAVGFCKTSGSRGLHIYIPVDAVYSYEQVRGFAELLSRCVHGALPEITSMERTPSRRVGKVYLDYLQNRRGATMAAIYSVRPRPHATVSTPVTWGEVNQKLDPTAFTIRTVLPRVAKIGDLWGNIASTRTDLETCYQRLRMYTERKA